MLRRVLSVPTTPDQRVQAHARPKSAQTHGRLSKHAQARTASAPRMARVALGPQGGERTRTGHAGTIGGGESLLRLQLVVVRGHLREVASPACMRPPTRHGSRPHMWSGDEQRCMHACVRAAATIHTGTRRFEQMTARPLARLAAAFNAPAVRLHARGCRRCKAHALQGVGACRRVARKAARPRQAARTHAQRRLWCWWPGVALCTRKRRPCDSTAGHARGRRCDNAPCSTRAALRYGTRGPCLGGTHSAGVCRAAGC